MREARYITLLVQHKGRHNREKGILACLDKPMVSSRRPVIHRLISYGDISNQFLLSLVKVFFECAII